MSGDIRERLWIWFEDSCSTRSQLLDDEAVEDGLTESDLGVVLDGNRVTWDKAQAIKRLLERHGR